MNQEPIIRSRVEIKALSAMGMVLPVYSLLPQSSAERPRNRGREKVECFRHGSAGDILLAELSARDISITPVSP